jgi:L-aminopeptidase/D-esterase-like protein
MNTMLTSIKGLKVGHYTDPDSLTGCTVILCPPDTVGSCEVRGSSPGCRETSLLDPSKKMNQVNAVVLSGGAAFGLAAAEGAVKYLTERTVGYETPWAVVPIVPAAVVYDLNIGSSEIRPSAEQGYAACKAATDGEIERGSVGAGTGATVGKWMGMQYLMKGGVGVSSQNHGDLIVSALSVVNSIGDVYDENGSVLAGARHPGGGFWAEKDPGARFRGVPLPLNVNTTLVVVATNAKLPKIDVFKMCQRSQAGMARAIKPVHTSHDGDCVFGFSAGDLDIEFDFVAEMAAEATADAVRDAVRTARGTTGAPGLG